MHSLKAPGIFFRRISFLTERIIYHCYYDCFVLRASLRIFFQLFLARRRSGGARLETHAAAAQARVAAAAVVAAGAVAAEAALKAVAERRQRRLTFDAIRI